MDQASKTAFELDRIVTEDACSLDVFYATIASHDSSNYYQLRHAHDCMYDTEDAKAQMRTIDQEHLRAYHSQAIGRFPTLVDGTRHQVWQVELRRVLYEAGWTLAVNDREGRQIRFDALCELLRGMPVDDAGDTSTLALNVFRVRMYSLYVWTIPITGDAHEALLGDVNCYTNSALVSDLIDPERLHVIVIALRSLWLRSVEDGRWPIHSELFRYAADTSGSNLATDNARQGVNHMLNVIGGNGYTVELLDSVSSLSRMSPEFMRRHDLREDISVYMRRYFVALRSVQLKSQVGTLLAHYVRHVALFPPDADEEEPGASETRVIMDVLEKQISRVWKLRKRKRVWIKLSDERRSACNSARLRATCGLMVAINERQTLRGGFTDEVELAEDGCDDFVEAFRGTRVCRIHDLHTALMRRDEEDAAGHVSPILGAPRNHVAALLRLQQLHAGKEGFDYAVDRYLDTLCVMQTLSSAGYSYTNHHWGAVLHFLCGNVQHLHDPKEILGCMDRLRTTLATTKRFRLL
ncbi:hypothetical protein CYMTET_54276 [Cymbomonas tetramitiformis]|uniref:Uncharacterized protein n=1 Tax=Cymbomonas tetramitiformis TaxID=36881 RepID=A0AAE0BGE5_9CHLO|nr:hypothetical protein CYMTET_54276 [Cymbomonas tetramitiformis]